MGDIKFGNDARTEMKKGADILANAVKVTLGARGRNVFISNKFGIRQATKDGVTVAKAIAGSIDDPLQNAGAELVADVAIKVAEDAGDGTTTATVITQAILEEGLKNIAAGTSPIELKKGIDLATKQVVEYLNSVSENVTNVKIKDIATISANNDDEIGMMIVNAVKAVGRQGVITPEESKGTETYVETIEGLEFEGGYLSHYFVTNVDKMTTEMESPAIYIYDGTLNDIHQIMPLISFVKDNGFPLLIIANDISGDILNILAVNRQKNNFPVVAVRSPYMGGARKEFLEDIAISTGAEVVVSDMEGFDPRVLGGCDKIVIKKDSSIIIKGHGDKARIKERVDNLKERASDKKADNIPFLKERMSKLSGGIAIVHVGGNTTAEMKEKYDRVEDALYAVKSAIEEGIVSGGGIVFLNARAHINFSEAGSSEQLTGMNIVADAIVKPLKQILINAGLSPDVIINDISKLEEGYGYDVKQHQYLNMKTAGIIDPKKVSRVALESASSIAGIILTTECSILN